MKAIKVEIRKNEKLDFGLYALTDIAEGEEIFVEQSKVFHKLTVEDMLKSAGDACFLVEKIIRNPKMGREFNRFDLKRNRTSDIKIGADDKFYLMRISNKYNVDYLEVYEIWQIVISYYITLFYEGSDPKLQMSQLCNRLNHSCDPNSSIIANTTSLKKFNKNEATCVALRPIKKAEELTIWYLSKSHAFLDIEKRRSALLNCYGFLCLCKSCIAE